MWRGVSLPRAVTGLAFPSEGPPQGLESLCSFWSHQAPKGLQACASNLKVCLGTG